MAKINVFRKIYPGLSKVVLKEKKKCDRTLKEFKQLLVVEVKNFWE